MTAHHGNKSQILLTSYPSLALSNFALTDSGDHTTFTTPVGQAAKRQWDNTASFTFQTSPDGSTWTTVVPALVQYVGGQVTFPAAVSGGTPSARVSVGAYLPYAAVATSTGFSADLDREVKENTVQTVNSTPVRFKTYQPGLLSGTMKLMGFTADPTYLPLVTATSPLVASLVMDVTTGSRVEFACMLTKDGYKTAIGELETEDLEIKINGQVYIIP